MLTDILASAARIGEVLARNLEIALATNHIDLGLAFYADYEQLLTLCVANAQIWALEDCCRSRDDAVVAGAKRLIDKANQVRNDLIEAIDVQFFSREHQPAPVVVTETPGQIIDRLVVVELRKRCYSDHGRHDDMLACQNQRSLLITSYLRLVAAWQHRRISIMPFRQLKTYNSRATNPHYDLDDEFTPLNQAPQS